MEPSGVITYPNPHHLLSEIPATVAFPAATPAIPPRSGIVVVSRDNAGRLEATLPGLAALPCPIVLIDDSTTVKSRGACRKLCKKLGVRYHGRRQQDKVLAGVDPKLLTGLVVPLGRPGWTLGYCRNYSLLAARDLGLERVLLIDDDITIPSADLPARTFDLLGRFDYAGSRTVGLADDSVVGHVARSLGVEQYDFVTGQYLGVRMRMQEAFFPNLYNEDLIFLFIAARPASIARYGTVSQMNRRHRGSAVNRALGQELGEIHCEGCIRASIGRNKEGLAEPDFWTQALEFRWRSLRDLIARDQEWGRARFSALLERVLAYSRTLKPEGFASFHREYRALSSRWLDLQLAIG